MLHAYAYVLRGGTVSSTTFQPPEACGSRLAWAENKGAIVGSCTSFGSSDCKHFEMGIGMISSDGDNDICGPLVALVVGDNWRAARHSVLQADLLLNSITML